MRWRGLAVGVVLALLVRWVMPLGTAGRHVATVAVLMTVCWMTEAIPPALTALLPLVLLPLLGVAPLTEVAAPYASPVVFLLLGGFLLAVALRRCRLPTRFALATVLLTGTSPGRVIGGFMLATGVLSMWLSATPAALVMLPVAASVLSLAPPPGHGRPDRGHERHFAAALTLGIAYAASIGSLGTIVGAPSNAFLQAYVAEHHGIEIGFLPWMAFGVPLVAVFLAAAWLVLTRLVLRPRTPGIPGGREAMRRRRRELGPVSRVEWTVLAVFAATVAGWVLVGVVGPWVDWVDAGVWNAGVAVAAAVLLFLLPAGRGTRRQVLTWDDTREVPWGVLLLVGGGLSLSSQFGPERSGFAWWFGDQVFDVRKEVPTLVLMALLAAVVLLLAQLTSATVASAMFLPLAGAVAASLDHEVLLYALPVVLSASCAFLLPVGAAPNAAAFGSGHITLGQMARAGAALTVVALTLVTLAVYVLGAAVFGAST